MISKVLIILGIVLSIPLVYLLINGGHSIVALAALMAFLLGVILAIIGIILFVMQKLNVEKT